MVGEFRAANRGGGWTDGAWRFCRIPRRKQIGPAVFFAPLSFCVVSLDFGTLTPVVVCAGHPQGATTEGKPRSAGMLEHGEGEGEESVAVGSK